MILAVWDYICFRKLKGRYLPYASGRLSNMCFYESIPEIFLEEMKTGDTIIMGNNNNFISWLVMYATDSVYSHLAVYQSDRTIFHMTLEGPIVESIESLFGRKKRFMIARHKSELKSIRSSDFLNQENLPKIFRKKYTKFRTFLKGMKFCLCIHPLGFSLRNFIDLNIIVLSGAAISFLLKAWVVLAFCGLFVLWVWVLQTIRFIKKLPSVYPETPESFIRAHDCLGFDLLYNMSGYQSYMMSAHEYLISKFGEKGLVVGRSYRLPDGAKLQISPTLEDENERSED